MARPDPQALLDAAAALRSQATAGRRAVDEQLQKRDAEIGHQHDRAVQRQQVAEQAVKAAEATRKQETTERPGLAGQAAIDSEKRRRRGREEG